jgi:hypothetical protein
VTSVDDIAPGSGQQLAETRALSSTNHLSTTVGELPSGGPRQAELEPQSLLNLSDREIKQISDRLCGLTSSELLCDHLRRHRPNHRPPVLMQWIQRYQPPELRRNHSIRLRVGIAYIPEITNKTSHRSRHHQLTTAHHDEYLVTGDTYFPLDVAHQLATIDIEERPGVRERIPAELLTQSNHRRTQAMHRRAAHAELSEQPRLDELPQVTSSSRVRSTRTTGG